MSNYTASSPTIEFEKYSKMSFVTVYGDRWEAKQKIEQLFKKRDVLWYSDIAEILGLDLELIVDICRELIEEGKIEDATKTD